MTEEWLEETHLRRFGPGTPFAEFLNLPREKAQLLVPPTKSNSRLPESVLAELLTLNRSHLDEAELTRQKALVVERAKNAMVGTI